MTRTPSDTTACAHAQRPPFASTGRMCLVTGWSAPTDARSLARMPAWHCPLPPQAYLVCKDRCWTHYFTGAALCLNPHVVAHRCEGAVLASHRHQHLRHLGVLGRMAHQGRHFESCTDTQHVCKPCCAEGHVLPQVSVTLPQLSPVERAVQLGTVLVRALHVGDNVGASALLLCYACLLGVSLHAARIEASC